VQRIKSCGRELHRPKKLTLACFGGRRYAWDRVLLYGKGGGAWVGSNNPTVTIFASSSALARSFF
jgi:hypothetical protein